MNAWSIGLLVVMTTATFASAGVVADAKRPTCEEKPALRDCVKVEEPDAQPPAPSVYRQKKPVPPVARPQSGRSKGGEN